MKVNVKRGWSRRVKFCVWGLTVLALGAACILFAKSRFESRAKRNVFPQELLAALGNGAEERCVTLVNGDVDKAKVKMDEVKSEEKVEAVKIRLPLPASVKTTEEAVREILRKAGKRIGRVHTNGIEKLTAPYKGDASTNGNEVEWRKALKSVLASTGYNFVEKGDVVLFGRVEEVEIKRRYLPQECLLEQQECLSEQRQRQRECLWNNRTPIIFSTPLDGLALDDAIRYIVKKAKLSIPVDYFEYKPVGLLYGGKYWTRFDTNGQKIPWQVVLREVLHPHDYSFTERDGRLVVARRAKIAQWECERLMASRLHYKWAQLWRTHTAEVKLKSAQIARTKSDATASAAEARVAPPRKIKPPVPERRAAPPTSARAKTAKPYKTVALKNDNAPRTIKVVGLVDDADAVTVGTADESGAESAADSISADEILNAAAEASGDPRVKFRLTHQMLEGMVIPPSSEIAETLEDAVRDILAQAGKQIGVVSTNGIEKLTMPYQQLGDGKSYECEWRKALRLLLFPVGYNFTEDGELVLFGLTDEVDYKHKHLAEERLAANRTPILFSADKSEGGMALRAAIRDVAVKANVTITTDFMEPADLYDLIDATEGMLTVSEVAMAKKLVGLRTKVKYTMFSTNGERIEWRKVLKGILSPHGYDFKETNGIVLIAKKAKFAAWEEEDRKRKELDRKQRENNFLRELGWSSRADPHEFAREVVQRDGGKSAGLRHNRDRLIRMRDEGDVRAGTLLGLHYFLGDDCVQHVCDQELAACYLEQTAEFGDVDAQWMIGLMCYRSDELKSFRFVKRVADAGNVAAQSLLGFMYGYGAGVVCNPEQAIRYFSLAAKAGDVEAKCQLGICHATGFGCRKDPAKAVELYRSAAESGDLTAKTLLAHAVYYGIGVEANREEGRALMEKVKLVGGVDALEFSDLYESERR